MGKWARGREGRKGLRLEGMTGQSLDPNWKATLSPYFCCWALRSQGDREKLNEKTKVMMSQTARREQSQLCGAGGTVLTKLKKLQIGCKKKKDISLSSSLH